MLRARVLVRLKREVLDPQGEAVRRGLAALGVDAVREVRVGKVLEVELAGDREAARAQLERAARELFANPVLEEFELEWLEGEGPAPR